MEAAAVAYPPFGYPGYPPPPSMPIAYDVVGPWTPPGLAGPWPPQEYLRDGGDDSLPVSVAPDWKVRGLELSDTVAHYDTIDGRTEVTPSNRVHIYAPRFGAVRQLTGVQLYERADKAGGVTQPEGLVRYESSELAATGLQRVQIGLNRGSTLPSEYEMGRGEGAVSGTLTPGGFQDRFMAFENVELIRTGKIHQGDEARLALGLTAAVVWSGDQEVQVTINNQTATAFTNDSKAMQIFTVEDPTNSPRLRVVKVASTQLAQPGDTVDFTIRFDNVGDQPLGNVVLMDNLTTRLEYVEGSAQSSVEAEFSSGPNEGGSSVLRWQITEAVPVGEGGIVRFECRVR